MHTDQNYCHRCNKDGQRRTYIVPTDKPGLSMDKCLEPCLKEWEGKRLCKLCMVTMEMEWVLNIPEKDLGLYVNYDFLHEKNMERYQARLGKGPMPTISDDTRIKVLKVLT